MSHGINKDMIPTSAQDLLNELVSFVQRRKKLPIFTSPFRAKTVIYLASFNGDTYGELCLSIKTGKIPRVKPGRKEPKRKATSTKQRSKRNSTAFSELERFLVHPMCKELLSQIQKYKYKYKKQANRKELK